MAKLIRIEYKALNPVQQENYNFHHACSILVDFGYTSIFRISDDWGGADFIALHANGKQQLKVQLKSRLTVSKKYVNKDLHIMFSFDDKWYIIPHVALLRILSGKSSFAKTDSWVNPKKGTYSFKKIPFKIVRSLSKYLVTP